MNRTVTVSATILVVGIIVGLFYLTQNANLPEQPIFPPANGQGDFTCERLGTAGNIRYIVCTFPNGEQVRCLTDVASISNGVGIGISCDW